VSSIADDLGSRFVGPGGKGGKTSTTKGN